MTVKAKFRCEQASPNYGDAKDITLVPVYSADPASENYSWSKARPSGRIQMTISNPAAHAQFEPGREYLVTFEPVPPT